MAAVMIGVDPHKGSHTAVAIGAAEEVLGQVRVRACAAQARQLLAWANTWPERTWAVEGAGGLGHLLAQQLVAAGERVLDVPPKLAARVRLLGSGATGKSDPNDARSVAIAALRPGACPLVRADDHTAVLKVWAKRHRDLSRSRNQVVCRLHAVLCDLVPGGVSKRITAGQAARVLDQAQPRGAAGAARWILAQQFLSDLRRIDAQRLDVKKKLATAVRASGTTVTEIFGVGPAVAAAVLGDVGDISRFPGPGSFAACNGTAPVEASSGNRVVYRLSLRGNRRMNHAVHMAAVTQVRYPGTEGRAYYDKKIAEGKTSKEALRALKRQVSDALYKQMKADARRMADPAGPGGHPGNGSVASVAGSHPEGRLFGKATPGPDPTLRPQPGPSKAARPGNSPRTRRPVPARTSALARAAPPCPGQACVPHRQGQALACPLFPAARAAHQKTAAAKPPPLDITNKEESIWRFSAVLGNGQEVVPEWWFCARYRCGYLVMTRLHITRMTTALTMRTSIRDLQPFPVSCARVATAHSASVRCAGLGYRHPAHGGPVGTSRSWRCLSLGCVSAQIPWSGCRPGRRGNPYAALSQAGCAVTG